MPIFLEDALSQAGGRSAAVQQRPDVLLEESVMELYEEALLQPVKSRLVMKSMMMSIFAYILRWDEKDVVRLKRKGIKGNTFLPSICFI